MTLKEYTKGWFSDFDKVFRNEFHAIFTDGGVMLIFFVAGLIYPLLYNLVYLNGILNETPIAVVDNANCAESRRYTREMDATREVTVEYRCTSMEEAENLLKERKVNGIVYFPDDFGKKLAYHEQATVSVYCDMSSFLYYKNALMAANHVMLAELDEIQIERYAAAGYSDQEISQLVRPVPYEDKNPYNNAFSYSIFLLSAILFVIIQQTMFYGMSLLEGTARERRNSLAALPMSMTHHGTGRIVLGKGSAYWLIYMAISIYIAYIVPAIFGMPQRGNFWDILVIVAFFVTDCVVYSLAWSATITRRESVFVLFLFMSPICLFLTGTSWPQSAFPKFWDLFSYLFPTTFGCKAFLNVGVAGGDLSCARDQLVAMTIQTIIYYLLASVAVNVENWVMVNKEAIEEKRNKIEMKVGIDREKEIRMIAGDEAADEFRDRLNKIR